MKQLLKLAELNMTLVRAQREVIAAKDEDSLDSAKSKVESAQDAVDAHLKGKRLENEFNKYQERKDEVRTALVAAGHDTAIMDYWG